ncbi:hypothetical protein [Arcobacter roscoffensis]|uniref:Uncharacterized protein n=1 Tax=Arcobacter roscoffensis TaxID=2961520 RepID=A0ABY5E696_9BACT|nr:hypothetical protein [Arcobacter roscoffensis]UTJ07694.1 hypothetical protein NJU99_06270 [Arcobacter roscoffensis]
MTVSTSNNLNHLIQKVQSSNKTQNTKESSMIQKEELGEKKDSERYNFLTANGWLDNSIIMKDEKLNAEFRNYVDNMSEDEYFSFLTSMACDFAPGFGNNINNLPLNEAPSKKDPNIEFSSLSSIKKYFTDEYNEVLTNTAKWGGDTTNAINTITNLLDFFKNYESKEQEKQYITLGQGSINV